jgi:hypothetical protein
MPIAAMSLKRAGWSNKRPTATDAIRICHSERGEESAFNAEADSSAFSFGMTGILNTHSNSPCHSSA